MTTTSTTTPSPGPARSRLSWLALVTVAACAPSSSQVFRPVASAAAERTGYQVAWRSPMMHDARIRQAVTELLADELTLDEAVRVALLNNRRLQAAFDELGIARGDLAAASVLSNPEIEAELRFPFDGDAPDLELRAAQDVLDLIALRGRRHVAEAELEAARAEAIGAVVDLVAATRVAYYEAQADEQRLELRASIADAVDASYTLAQRLHEAGNISDLTLLRERDFRQQAQLELAAARATRAESRERLTAALGLWGSDAAYQLPARLPELPDDDGELADIEARAVARNLELEGERWRMRAAAGRVSVARLQRWLPELGVGVIAERDGGDGSWSVGPTVGLSLPLWNRNGGQISRGQAELSRSRNRYYALAVDVRAEARATRDRLRAARERARTYRDTVLPLRADVVEQTQLAYNAMAASPFELFEAKRRQIEAGASYVDALLEYWRARAAADQLLAGRTPTAAVSRNDEPAAPDQGGINGEH